MLKNKSGFNNKFANYLNNILDKEKKDRLFPRQTGDRTTEPKRSSTSSVFPFSEFNTFDQHTSISRKDRSSGQSGQRPEQEDPSPMKRRRLKKLRELEENQCGICLEQIKKQSHLKCKHNFCYDCLTEWFQNSNKCPYCRQEVRSFWFKGEEILVKTKKPRFEEESYEQAEEQMDYVCYNCEDTQEGDIVLICDQCQISACHVNCDSSLRGIMPDGQWICHFCR